jgi:hypothetical protein
MANQVQESIQRDAADIEERKVGLMDSAKVLTDAANLNALSGEYLTPDYEVAGLSPDQLTALQMGRQGIGAYQPFLTAGARDVTSGSTTIGEAAGAACQRHRCRVSLRLHRCLPPPLLVLLSSSSPPHHCVISCRFPGAMLNTPTITCVN